MHLFAPDVGLYGTNGLVADGMPVGVGLGLAAKLKQTDRVAVVFFGDGAANHGACHESLNFAAVQDLPVIFVCENNMYATDTPLWLATRNTDLATRAEGYGMPGVSVDGNDVEAVYKAAKEAVARARQGEGPTLIEAKTYRLCGHHEGDVPLGSYQSAEEADQWKQKDPIPALRAKLLKKRSVSAAQLNGIDKAVGRRIQAAVRFALKQEAPDPATAYDHVYAESPPPVEISPDAWNDTTSANWMTAVCAGIAEEMRRDPSIAYLGEGVGKRGGCFGHSMGLWQEFGRDRVIDTPISEAGFAGAAVGAAAAGCRPVADLMFADFMFDASPQIVQQAAKLRYVSNGQLGAPVVFRAMIGSIKNTGPHHSGCYHSIWAHQPGLMVAIPSTPADAKGLFKTALRSSDPVVFLEHKQLLSMIGPVPKEEYSIPFGVAAVLRQGTDVTLVACGLMVRRCLEAAEQLAAKRISCEVIDLRTVVPLDLDTVTDSLRKTGKLVVVDEGYSMCGLGAEIGQSLMESAFDCLDAPIARLHTGPATHPFSPLLEAEITVTTERICSAARDMLIGKAPVPRSYMGHVEHALPSRSAPPVVIPVEVDHTPEPAATTGGTPLMLPNQDLTVQEATVQKWLKRVGDEVKEGEPVVEVETDKAVVEVEALASGTLVEILVQEGETASFGDAIALLAQ